MFSAPQEQSRYGIIIYGANNTSLDVREARSTIIKFQIGLSLLLVHDTETEYTCTVFITHFKIGLNILLVLR